jgi:L-cysteine:1D-myo-inositol 2-amino-2-deoxy-alpha-D-glucopyranoside ligase
MSKSLGNLVFVGELLKEWEPSVLRVALLDHHYRTDWDWTDEDMPRAARRLELWRSAPAGESAGQVHDGDDPALAAVRSALDQDLDTPGALAALDGAASAGRPVVRGAHLLGVTL